MPARESIQILIHTDASTGGHGCVGCLGCTLPNRLGDWIAVFQRLRPAYKSTCKRRRRHTRAAGCKGGLQARAIGNSENNVDTRPVKVLVWATESGRWHRAEFRSMRHG